MSLSLTEALELHELIGGAIHLVAFSDDAALRRAVQEDLRRARELAAVSVADAISATDDDAPGLPDELRELIREALCGGSNDAEHDALVALAEHFDVEWTRPDDA